MRLFIAINFNEKVKSKLLEAQNHLKKYTIYGNFSAKENLHLTLIFLGDIRYSELGGIKNVIDNIIAKPFKICINSLGSFKKEGGDIYWIGIKHSSQLLKLQNDVILNLKKIGFDFPDKFFPHITIARQTSLTKDFNKNTFNHNFGNVYSEISRISLMESTKTSERLIYTEIYSKEL